MDEFKKYYKHAYNNNENNESGKIISEANYNRLCSLTEDHGGKILMGNANAHKDKKLELTVVLNPKKGSKLMAEEIFGPILPIITFNHFDEVIRYTTIEQEKPLVFYFFGPKDN